MSTNKGTLKAMGSGPPNMFILGSLTLHKVSLSNASLGAENMGSNFDALPMRHFGITCLMCPRNLRFLTEHVTFWDGWDTHFVAPVGPNLGSSTIEMKSSPFDSHG